ncbi:MAG TPA: FeoA family protein [Lachnospiraceae bacterium]|nr:FeoA family protein [Lachnospiraceae bacterium]
MTLNEIPVGKSGVITAVGGEGTLRLRLLDMGLIPKTKVTVQKIAPLGDPIEILIRGYELTLRIADAKMIDVESEEEYTKEHVTQGTIGHTEAKEGRAL